MDESDASEEISEWFRIHSLRASSRSSAAKSIESQNRDEALKVFPEFTLLRCVIFSPDKVDYQWKSMRLRFGSFEQIDEPIL